MQPRRKEVAISHDRWFLDRIATHMLAFEGDSHVEWFEGNYQDYEKDRKKRLGTAADTPHRSSTGASTRSHSERQAASLLRSSHCSKRGEQQQPRHRRERGWQPHDLLKGKRMTYPIRFRTDCLIGLQAR